MTEPFIPLSAREPGKYVVEKPEKGDEPATIFFKRPSPMDRQRVHAIMFEAGLRNPENTLIRKAQYNALITMFPDDGEEKANRLQMYYDAQDAFVREVLDWGERERERQKDEANGAKPRPMEDLPRHPMDKREIEACELLSTQANEDPYVTRLLGQAARYQADLAFWTVRAHILAHKAQGLPPALNLEMKDGLLTEASLDDLIDYIGNPEFKNLSDAIDAQYGVSEETRKNSESLPEISPQTEQRSEPASTELAKPHGSSTISNTGPIPESASEAIIEPSLSMSSEPDTSTENASPTAAPE